MWRSTERMARAVSEGLKAGGVEVRLMSMDQVHRSQVVYELLDAGALVCGSPTLNNNLLPQMADVMTYLKGLKPRNLLGAAFGSYGWSGEAVRQLNDLLEEMKVERVGEGIRVKHRPDAACLAECYALGRSIGERLQAASGKH
jgi:flavorubredoxin